MKQTAVEWFMEQIGEKQPNGLYVISTLEDVQNVFQQAKEIEKEQIKDAYWDGGQDVPLHINTCEEWYKQTYGGNK
jgi:hypothetical protein